MYRNFTTILALLGLLLVSGSLFSQSPGGISRKSLWLKGNFFEDSTLARTLNFNPATVLDEVTPGIKFPGTIDDLRRSTIFTVFQQPDISQDKLVWELSDGHGDMKLTSRQLSSMSQKTHLAFADSLSDLFQSGPQSIVSTYIRRERAQDDANAGSQDAVIQFGRLNTSRQPDQAQGVQAQGLIAEFIVYKTILKDKDIARIETYLGLKYGITLQRNYLNGAGETIWNRKEVKRYSNNIAGIGRDDQSGLYQKQGTSSSGTDQMIIGVNKIVRLNSNNNGQINDNDYLIWGDNDSPFDLERNKKPREGNILLSEKRWLMKSSGLSANTISTQLKINIRTLLPDGLTNQNVYLVIDRSGTGNFNLKECTYVLPDNITDDGFASFSGINWDTDRSGEDVFTFGVNDRKPENGVDGSGKILSFNVYPNPATNGNYQVAVTLDKPADITMQIYDSHLRLIESRKMNGESSYRFSGKVNGAAGVYIIKVLTPSNIYSKIMIVQ
jgi:hypothetical protein